jgi:RimJ/RimL family protein N-acetyltransferase
MSVEFLIDDFPKEVTLADGFTCELRPLESADEEALHQFFLDLPPEELLFTKHRVTERPVISDWCQNIDLDRNLPLLAFQDGKVLGVATLHQQLGGWKRHIGRVSVHIHPGFRGRGLAREMITEIIELARHCGLEKIEAEFIGEQVSGMKVFALLGFNELYRLPRYVRDMQTHKHDYIMMGLHLITREEYAGMG